MRYLDLIWKGVKMLPEIVMVVLDTVVAVNKVRKEVRDERKEKKKE